MTKSFAVLHRLVKAYAIIFVFWGLYRLIFRLPEPIEETILKPMVFVGGVLAVEKPKRWDKFFADVWGKGDWLRALLMGMGFGIAYMMFYGISSLLSFGSLQFSADSGNESWISFLGVGLLTAVWEEWLFSGYIFSHLKKIAPAMTARITCAALFALIHVPILLAWYKFTGMTLVFQLLLLFVLGFANVFLVGYSKNVLAPVVSHSLWGAAIFLFR